MVSWASGANAGNNVSGYGRYPGSGSFVPRSNWSAVKFNLTTPGSVDLNGPMRIQKFLPFSSCIVGRSQFIYVSGDIALSPTSRFSGTCYMAQSTAFAPGVVPTPSQIKANATFVYRGYNLEGGNGYLTAPGTIKLGYMDPAIFSDYLPLSSTVWDPNEKWWVMVAPTYHAAGSTDPTTDTPIGDINVNGRALSVWTNRTPLAPIITAPVGQTSARAGEVLTLTMKPQDPDRIASFPGDQAIVDFEDVAGVQIQYAPRPTESNPAPAWVDLPIADETGSALGVGWYIVKALEANSGAEKFWRTFVLDIKCGSSVGVLTPSTGYLPSGDWQVRVRTFDFGHNQPNTNFDLDLSGEVPPLVDYSGTYNPNNYPVENTSPWSEPRYIRVSEQVPAPVPLSPLNNIAIIEGEPVTLVWQYRNTYSPPFDQARRTVQIRKSGDTAWTTLVNNQVSSSTSLLVSGFGLVSGNAYEWRVRVEDSSGVISAYSAIARFWVVPVPASGSVIPEPGDSLDGATLGCGTHRVLIYRRGGKAYVGEIKNISKVEWNRVRDDMSDAVITVSGWGIDCGNLLAMLQTWAYEIVIFRDNGYGAERVWEGPITLLTYEHDKVTINAKDVMAYLYRRIIKQELRDSGNSPTAGRTVVERGGVVIQNALAADDPNVLAYLQLITREDDAKQYRSLPAYSRTAYEEVDDMAANAGLDYTAVGRAILLWGTKHRIGTLPTFRDKDLGNAPIVSEYGMSMANVYVVSDGNGVWGEANRLNADGQDPTYGLVEVLSSTWASDSAEEAGTFTQEGINEVSESFASAAERSIADKYPPPVVVRVPDNTRLNPDTVISIRHLVPGVIIPLISTSTLREVKASQKLDKVKVIEEKGEESITVTLSPFSRDDVEAVEGE